MTATIVTKLDATGECLVGAIAGHLTVAEKNEIARAVGLSWSGGMSDSVCFAEVLVADDSDGLKLIKLDSDGHRTLPGD